VLTKIVHFLVVVSVFFYAVGLVIDVAKNGSVTNINYSAPWSE